jgi:predicted nuclease of predicted toxin-antitoxin system
VLRLVSDENFKSEILRGLHRRLPDLDVVRVQDVGLAGSADPAILDWSAAEGRVVLTHDRQTMPRFAYDRVQAEQPMPGVLLVNDSMPTRQAIEELILAIQCLAPEECRGLVTYFPRSLRKVAMVTGSASAGAA